MPEIICLGEALIDFVADVSGASLAACPGFRKAAGGAAANVAAGVARLGGSAAFVGKVGDDPFGRFIEATLAECGVDTRALAFDFGARTGLAFVSLLEDGERDFVFFRHPSADMRLSLEDLPGNLFEEARVFHFGSITLIDEPSRSATLAAARRAREAGCLVSFDPNLRPPLWPSLEQAREEILAALPLADLVKVSEEEALFLSESGAGFPACPPNSGAGFPACPPQRARSTARATRTTRAPSARRAAAGLTHRGPRAVCVTLGAGGAAWVTEAGASVVPGYRVPVVDTTGAGDGFVAGLLCRLAAMGAAWELPPSEVESALHFANAVGALVCTRKGAIPAMPDAAAVAALMRGGPNDAE